MEALELEKFKIGDTVFIRLKNTYMYIGEVRTNDIKGRWLILSEGTILFKRFSDWEIFKKNDKIIGYPEISLIETLLFGTDLYNTYYAEKWI